MRAGASCSGSVKISEKELFVMTELLELKPDALVQPQAPLQDADSRRLEHAKSAHDLGLAALAIREKMPILAARATAWLDANGVDRVSEDERHVWKRYLPTAYWSVYDYRDDRYLGGHLSFAAYAFHEGVPTPVRSRMAEIKNGLDAVGASYTFEIRTPERAISDPVCFLHIITAVTNSDDAKRITYRVGRWGKDSSADFLPSLEDVKAILAVRERRSNANVLGACAGCVATILALGLAAYVIATTGIVPNEHQKDVNFSLAIALFVVGAASIWAFVSMFQRRVLREFQANHPKLVALT